MSRVGDRQDADPFGAPGFEALRSIPALSSGSSSCPAAVCVQSVETRARRPLW